MSDTYLKLITEIIVIISSILLFILSGFLLTWLIISHLKIKFHSDSINKGV